MTSNPDIRRVMIGLAIVLCGLSLALPIAGSYWATDAKRAAAMANAHNERADQTALLRQMRDRAQVMARNQGRLCTALKVACEP